MSYGTNFCFTYFGELPCDLSELGSQILETGGIRGGVYQQEVCGSTGRLHIQGFIQCIRSTRFTSATRKLQSLLPGAHVEKCLGSVESNVEYCSKEQSRAPGTMSYTFGDVRRVGQGTRSDLEEVSSVYRMLVYDEEEPIGISLPFQ